MSWKCDFCDSYNVEELRQCYVCGQPRSAESIREGKIRERAERIKRINAGIDKNAYGVLRIVFVSGLAASLVITFIFLIVRMVSGQLDEIWLSASAAFKNVENHLRFSFGGALPFLVNHMASGSFKDVAANVQVIWLVFGKDLLIFAHTAFVLIPSMVKRSIMVGYHNGIVSVLQRVTTHLGVLGMAITTLASNVTESLGCLFKVITGMFNRAIEHFN